MVYQPRPATRRFSDLGGAADKRYSFGVIGSPAHRLQEYHRGMKVISATVVRGRVSAELPFADGTPVLVVSRIDDTPVRLSGAELAELEAGIAEADRGELIPGDQFLEELKRFERQ